MRPPALLSDQFPYPYELHTVTDDAREKKGKKYIPGVVIIYDRSHL